VDDDLVGRIGLLQEDGEVESGRPAADDGDPHADGTISAREKEASRN
jgi:hypothetical protein